MAKKHVTTALVMGALALGMVAVSATSAQATNKNPCNASGKMDTGWDTASTKVVNAGCPLIKVQGEFLDHGGATYYMSRTKTYPVSGSTYSTFITDGEVMRWRGCSNLTANSSDCPVYSSWFVATSWLVYPGTL